MKLLIKFNIFFAVVSVTGLALTGVIARDLLEDGAREEVLGRARLMMEKAISVRDYTSAQIAPLLQGQMKYSFLPQSVPAYSATEVLAGVQKKYPQYEYKEATLNPTNPRDRALEWEADIVNQFRRADDRVEFIGERETPAGRAVYIARPIRITNAACLACHSTAEAAPRPLVERYGPSNGFGWQMNEVVGAQIVSVPMDIPFMRAQHSWERLMLTIAAVFVALGVVLNLALWLMVVRPLGKLVKVADGYTPEVQEKVDEREDEIGALAKTILKLRRRVRQQAREQLEAA